MEHRIVVTAQQLASQVGVDALRRLVSYGLGVAIVPASAALLPVRGVTFRRLQPSELRSRLVVLRAPRATHEAWEQRLRPSWWPRQAAGRAPVLTNRRQRR